MGEAESSESRHEHSRRSRNRKQHHVGCAASKPRLSCIIGQPRPLCASPFDRSSPDGVSGARFNEDRGCYLEIAVNRSEFTRLMNLRSSVSNLILRALLSESTAIFSRASFSAGVEFIFLYRMPACSSEERVAAVNESDVLTFKSNFTPLLRSILYAEALMRSLITL